MRVLLNQHVTDRNPDLDLSPNSLYRQNSLLAIVAIEQGFTIVKFLMIIVKIF